MFTCGEAISVALMSHVLKRAGIPAVGLTSAQARIFTDGRPVESDIVRIDTSRLRALLAAGQVPVITGGQGVVPDTLDYTTLGRGGSDTSGVAVGAALGAERVDIFTDVSGIAVVDPRLVPGARVLGRVSYGAMFELARFGARVVHPRAILTGWQTHTPLAVRSTFTAGPGTIVGEVEDEAPIVGVAILPPMETVTLLPGSVQGATRDEWERRHLIMSVTDGSSGVVFAGAAADKAADLRRLEETHALSPEKRVGLACWLSLVGEAGALREQHPRLATRLAQSAISVYGCEVGERRCTWVLPEAARTRAVALVHESIWPSP
jgi:aspartate kinase